MPSQDAIQKVAEGYARKQLDLEAAIQQIIAILKARKSLGGTESVSIHRPREGTLSPEQLQRIESLIQAVDRHIATP